MEVREVLNEAADLIENVGWTQGAMARDTHGLAVNSRYNKYTAVCYCTLGAINKICNGDAKSFSASFDFVSSRIPGNEITAWNDASERTAAEVISTLRTIAALPEANA